jgi:hypothetical protein
LNDPGAIIKHFSTTDPDYGPSLLLDAGPLPDSKGSTILDLTQTPVKCIRKGDDFYHLEKLPIDIIG